MDQQAELEKLRRDNRLMLAALNEIKGSTMLLVATWIAEMTLDRLEGDERLQRVDLIRVSTWDETARVFVP